MDDLLPLIARKPEKKKHAYLLEDQRTRQTLTITHDSGEFSVYAIDTNWQGRTTKGGPKGDVHEKSMDGVLVARFHDASVVCFIDLKGTIDDEEQWSHATAQIEATVRHYAPLHRKHEAPAPTGGDQHHDRWTDLDGNGPEEPLKRCRSIACSTKSAKREAPEARSHR